MIRLSELNSNLKQWKRKDYLFFFVVIPIVLLIIYLLPESIKYGFILQPSNPTVTSVFFSNYTHTELSHFAGNLISYFIIIFLLLNVETNKKLFYKTSLLIFILLPILASLLVVYFLPFLPPVQGFSAIDAAFLGYLLLSAYIHLKKYYTSSLGFSHCF